MGAEVAADGFSVPYRSALTAATYVYAALALLFLESELRRRHGRSLALLVVLAIWLATPLHFYMTANPAMAHGASVFAASAFVLAWLAVRSTPVVISRRWALVGMMGCLMSMGQLRLLGLTPLLALGLGQALGSLDRRLRPAAAGALALLALWTLSFEGVYNSGVVAPRDQAITYGELAAAQADALRRRVVALDGKIPARAWALAYGALGGTWVDGGRRSLGGRIDLGAEPPDMPFLVGRGWYDPQTEDGVTLRRSRGRGSWLRVALRAPADDEAVVRLKPEVPGLPLRVTFEVNRQPLGTAEVRAGWSEYTFAIPAAVLRRDRKS